MSTSPSRSASAAAKSCSLRSTCGPAASTGGQHFAGVRTQQRSAWPCPLLRPLGAGAARAWATISSGVPQATTVAAAFAGLGPHVDHPIGRLDHVQIVLDHDHRVAQVDQPVEHVQQPGEVVEVQAGRRLVEQIERPAGVGPGQLGRQLDALRFAARERRRRLAERASNRAPRRTASAARGESWGCSRTVRPPGRHDMSSTSAIDWP